MPACTLSPTDRRRQVQLVGNDLVKHYGKKRYYSVEEVKKAHQRQKIDIDLVCWSHASFNSHKDFDDYHQSIGESCDYVSMKSDMLSSVSTASDTSWFDIDLSWLEFPDIDFSLFDFFDL
jgi:predicted Co/Zn/Cd cation transporter (cation efflux family)